MERCEEDEDSRVGVGVVSRFRRWGLEDVVLCSCSLLVGSAVRERERSGRTSSAGVVVASFSLWARARSGRAALELCSAVSPFLVDPWPFSSLEVDGAPCASVAFLVSAMPVLDCVAAGSD
jgi:hypothetical protein